MSMSAGLSFSLSCLLMSLCAATRAPAARAAELSDSNESARIDDLFAQASRPGSPGAAVIVTRDGKILHRKCYGMANLEHAIPITPQTAFRVGSLTKPLVAMAILQLHEKGLLSLDDPIRKHLPRYSDAGKITVRHLLTHTSGISDFRLHPMQFEPGRRARYSNTNYLLLGKLIEKVSGRPCGGYLRDNVFAPLKMSNTGLDSPGRIVKNRASGYILDANDAFLNEPSTDVSIAFSAAGLFSTLDDLYLWDQALYTDRLLTHDTLEQAFSPAKLDDGTVTEYGLGWLIRDNDGLKEVTHAGSLGGFNACILRYPQRRFTVIVLSNLAICLNGPIPTAERAARQIADLYLADNQRPDGDSSQGLPIGPALPPLRCPPEPAATSQSRSG